MLTDFQKNFSPTDLAVNF